MTSNQQILTDLHLIIEADRSLDLMVTYKGVPYICKAKVLGIYGDRAKLKVSGTAMVCLQTQKRIKVLGSDFLEPATAEVVAFDILTGEVELDHFSYLAIKLGERMVVRVEPKTRVQVLIEIEGRMISGQLLDISLSGLGTLIQLPDYDPALKPGTTAELSLDLPNASVTISGTVISATRVSDGHRLSIGFAPDSPQRRTIFRYLVDRRAEIKHELKEEYRAALRLRGVEA
jgi:hypothetical protein